MPQQIAYLSHHLNSHKDKIEHLVARSIYQDQRSCLVPPLAVSQSMEKIPPVKRSRHYETICRPNIIPEFRVLALYEVHPGNTIATTIAEQVMMIYLGTMASANPIQKKFEQDMRAAVPGLPDLSEKGLNRGLPLAQRQHWMPRSQGLHKEWLTTTGQTSHCFNCGRPGNESCDEKGWVGWFENRRCQPCYNWR
jgi:hypothetical protein